MGGYLDIYDRLCSHLLIAKQCESVQSLAFSKCL